MRLKEERRFFWVPQLTFEKFVNIYSGARRLSGLRLSVGNFTVTMSQVVVQNLIKKTCDNSKCSMVPIVISVAPMDMDYIYL